MADARNEKSAASQVNLILSKISLDQDIRTIFLLVHNDLTNNILPQAIL